MAPRSVPSVGAAPLLIVFALLSSSFAQQPPAAAPAVEPTAAPTSTPPSSGASPPALISALPPSTPAPSSSASPPSSGASPPSSGNPPADAPSTAVCPITQQPPVAPSSPLIRCSSAGSSACCSTCQDASGVGSILASNQSLIFDFLKTVQIPDFPFLNIGQILGNLASQQFCNLFLNYTGCLSLIEQFYCGMACSADSADYLSVSNGNANLTLCSNFTGLFNESCGTIEITIPTVQRQVNQVLKNPITLFNLMVAPLLTAAIPGLNVLKAVPAEDGVNGQCFTAQPDTEGPSLCCDPLNDVPAECVNANNSNQFNRAVPASCPATNTSSTPTPASPAMPPPSPPNGALEVARLSTVLVGVHALAAWLLLLPLFV